MNFNSTLTLTQEILTTDELINLVFIRRKFIKDQLLEIDQKITKLENVMLLNRNKPTVKGSNFPSVLV